MPPLPLSKVLSDLPNELRDAVIEAFGNVRRNYIEGRWEPSELNGGKFSEVVYRILEWYTSKPRDFTPLGVQIKDFKTAVKRFENKTDMLNSIRFHIPDALAFLYTVRNKRGVGHPGGDINPNRMDAEITLGMTNWIMAELVRIFHASTVNEAQQTVEALVEKRNALVWEVANVKRILDPDMSHKDRVLVLLHSSHPSPIADKELLEWCEHSNPSAFRTQVLNKAHKEKLIEYDTAQQQVYLSPSGVEAAEQLLLRYESET